jgi:hypothetical protein
MNDVSWIGFCALGTLSSTALHFMPLSGEHLAPAPVFCQISLFGTVEDNEPLVFDGLRIAEPNGIELQSLFPNAQASQGEFCGFELRLWTEREELNLSSSECLVEIRNSHGLLRYRPKLRQLANQSKELSALVHEAFLQNKKISLVMPNFGQQSALMNIEEYVGKGVNQGKLESAQHHSAQHHSAQHCMVREVLPNGVEEIVLSQKESNTGTGELLHSSGYISSHIPGNGDSDLGANYFLKIKYLEHNVPIYALYRDANTGATKMVVEL